MAEKYDKGLKNTDREIWREVPGDYYSPSIFVTKENKIGINVGGYVIVSDVREWHRAGKQIIIALSAYNLKNTSD